AQTGATPPPPPPTQTSYKSAPTAPNHSKTNLLEKWPPSTAAARRSPHPPDDVPSASSPRCPPASTADTPTHHRSPTRFRAPSAWTPLPHAPHKDSSRSPLTAQQCRASVPSLQ